MDERDYRWHLRLKISLWDDMEVPSESFHWSSWDSRTCYPRRAFIQGLSDDILKTNPWKEGSKETKDKRKLFSLGDSWTKNEGEDNVQQQEEIFSLTLLSSLALIFLPAQQLLKGKFQTNAGRKRPLRTNHWSVLSGIQIRILVIHSRPSYTSYFLYQFPILCGSLWCMRLWTSKDFYSRKRIPKVNTKG